MPADRRARVGKHDGEMLTAVDAVDESVEPSGERRPSAPDGEVRRFAEGVERALHARADRDHVAERERCRQEPDDLAVGRRSAVHEGDGIGGDVAGRVVTLEERIEARLQTFGASGPRLAV